MSAPSSSGRVSTGVANVLSTPNSTPCRWAISAQAAMSVIDSSGLPGVSIQTSRVCGVMAASNAVEIGRRGKRHADAAAIANLVQQPIRAAIDIGAGQDVIARCPAASSRNGWRPCRTKMPARRLPPSSEPSVVSKALRVGLPLRE